MKLIFTLALAILFCSLNTASAATYPVTNTNDAGAGSLRQAILDANANPGADTVDVTGITGTITLTTGQLVISGALTITGPGANLLSITSSEDNNRIFYVGNVTATLSGLTIRDARLWAPDYDGNQENYDGAGILNYGQLTLESCIVSGNSGTNHFATVVVGCHGVGINNHGTMHVNNSIVRNNVPLFNETPILGGGIFNDGTLYITNSTVANNQANNGGGIYNNTTLTVTNSAITGNTGSHIGGGIETTSGEFTITNATISGNIGGDGGGIYILGGAGTILNSTITLNDGFGGGIYNYTYSSNGQAYPPGVFNIGNSIVAGNINHYNATAGADYSFPTGGIQPVEYANLTSLGYNIFGKVDDPWNWTFTGTGDQVGSYASPIDPLLGPLADNGGTTSTHALLTGSPAINTGSCVTTNDQRGIVWPQGITCDIGSYEFEECSPPTGLSTTNIASTSARLNWNAVPGAVKYKILYRVKGTSLWTTINRNTAKVSYTLTGLTPSTQYNWKMKTICSIGQSPVSTVKKFTTAAALLSQSQTTTSENATAESLDVAVMPNPNNGNFSVDLHLPANRKNTTLQLYNSLGVKVWQEDFGVIAGDVSKNFYLKNKVAAGAYVLIVQRDDLNYSTKIIISR